MAGEETTFGCGTYLPGFGPGNFPDFDGGGTIDGGGGDDPPGGGEDDWIDFDQDDDGDGGATPGGPSTPPVDITYWVCTQVTIYKKKCVAVTQSSTLPPPPGGYRDQATCKANCGDGGPTTPPPAGPTGPSFPGGGGPITPGPGGPTAPPPGTGAVCTCKIKGKPTRTSITGGANTKGI